VGGWLAGGLLAIAVLAGASAAIAAAPDRQDALQAFDRDVYVIVGASLRNPTADTPGDARLFSVVGAALPATWGEWQGASARSQVRTQPGNGGPSTDVRLTLSGLIPGGVYSVFYGTLGPDSEHPLCPGIERTLPLTAFRPERQEPDPSSFVADASGAARYHGRVEGALLEADQVFFSVVYHFDGRTSHPFPNRGELFTQGGECRASYGEDAMRQLLILQSGFGS
jgi:hypothetical protein